MSYKLMTSVQVACMTNVTRASFGLPSINKADRSIHSGNVYKSKAGGCTKPARQRDNLKKSSSGFAGGKRLRKARAKLTARLSTWSSSDGKRPGSMQS